MQKKANHLAAACLSVLTLTAAIGMPAVSAEHYNVYNYDRWDEATPSQAGYAAQRAVSGLDLGCGAFNTPSDLFRDWEDRFYIADSGNKRIVVTDSGFSKATRIRGRRNHTERSRGHLCVPGNPVHVHRRHRKFPSAGV